MSYLLIVFPNPTHASCLLESDTGLVVHGIPVVHPSGRPGQGFEISDGTTNGFGARLTISAPGRVTLEQRGILYLNDGLPFPWTDGQTAAFVADDFHLAPAGQALGRLVADGRYLAVEEA